MVCGCQGTIPETNKFTISGGYGEGVPPVPIPNTEVKPFSADGTWLDTARESRSPPDSNKKKHLTWGASFLYACNYIPSID